MKSDKIANEVNVSDFQSSNPEVFSRKLSVNLKDVEYLPLNNCYMVPGLILDRKDAERKSRLQRELEVPSTRKEHEKIQTEYDSIRGEPQLMILPYLSNLLGEDLQKWKDFVFPDIFFSIEPSKAKYPWDKTLN